MMLTKLDYCVTAKASQVKLLLLKFKKMDGFAPETGWTEGKKGL